MDFLRKFQPILPMSSLLIIQKTSMGNQVDCADNIYDQAYNSAFHDTLDSVYYNESSQYQAQL